METLVNKLWIEADDAPEMHHVEGAFVETVLTCFLMVEVNSLFALVAQVIRNSNDCNLAMEIWNLGCIVWKLATTKPPWNQYEGVAAMFKLGNFHRPTVAQLLEHPFVKYDAPLERPIQGPEPSDPPAGVTNGVKAQVGWVELNLSVCSEIDEEARNCQYFDSVDPPTCVRDQEVLPHLLEKVSALTLELDRSSEDLGKKYEEELERKKLEIENAFGRMKKYRYYLMFTWSIMAILILLFFAFVRI
uniref:Protein kinase domain-containing protein n=1 Tax=Fagus sylvatica TaxID=28930 RepID=A0A2N9J244_FAGSY